MRLRDTEDDIDLLRNKSRSLQTQVSKKTGFPTDRNVDEKIDQEIASFVKTDTREGPQKLYGRAEGE